MDSRVLIASGRACDVFEHGEVQPDALVLERVDGPTMLEEIERQPWRFFSRCRFLLCASERAAMRCGNGGWVPVGSARSTFQAYTT